MTAEVANLRHVLASADAIDRAEGLLAYSRYNQVMQRFAEHYEFTLAQTTAAFVALSPNNDYRGNLKSMATLLHGIRSGWPLAEIRCSTYKACRDRAWLYATGREEFLEHAGGPKTRAFYQNILDPSDVVPVTVDGHLIGAWLGRRLTMKEAVQQKIAAGARYERIAEDVRQVAAEAGLVPCQAQAVLWFAWKRLHRVLAAEQLGLWQGGDQWRTLVRPIEVGWWPRRDEAAQPRAVADDADSAEQLFLAPLLA